ncbi:hypothetical protein PM082_001124 [Marasmius tenuissimus]|nr:hypothetical protein PM082_001124 [Marasmius tenuissimus]
MGAVWRVKISSSEQGRVHLDPPLDAGANGVTGVWSTFVVSLVVQSPDLIASYTSCRGQAGQRDEDGTEDARTTSRSHTFGSYGQARRMGYEILVGQIQRYSGFYTTCESRERTGRNS